MMTGTTRPSSATAGMSSETWPRRIGRPPKISLQDPGDLFVGHLGIVRIAAAVGREQPLTVDQRAGAEQPRGRQRGAAEKRAAGEFIGTRHGAKALRPVPGKSSNSETARVRRKGQSSRYAGAAEGQPAITRTRLAPGTVDKPQAEPPQPVRRVTISRDPACTVAARGLRQGGRSVPRSGHRPATCVTRGGSLL